MPKKEENNKEDKIDTPTEIMKELMKYIKDIKQDLHLHTT